MTIKIVHIISGLKDGGAEAILYNFISKSNSKRVNHIVISLRNGGKYGKLLEEKKVKVFYLNFKLNISVPFKFFKLIFLLKSLKPDVVQTWMYHADLIGGLAAFLSNCKNIFWGIHHTSLAFDLNKKSIILIAFLNSFLSYIIPNKIICCAESAKYEHIKYGFAKRKIIVIHNGIDMNKFQESSLERINYRKKIKIKKNEILYGTVARFDPSKDHFTLLKTINILRKNGLKFKYLLVGSNMDNSNKFITRIIKKYRLEDIVILRGKENNISSVMNALDLHVLTSQSEAFPNVVLESISCGTPCISTNVGDVNKIILDNDYIVDKGNPILLSEKIIKFSKLSNKIRENLKVNSFKYIKSKFSIEKMSFLYLEVYKKYSI